MQIRKISLLLVVFTLVIVQTSEAQFSLGVNAGITRMKFSGDPAEGLGFFVPDPGFSSAFRMDYRFTDALALSLQPGYSKLRTSYFIMNDSATQAIDSTQLSMNAFSLPLNLLVWSQNGRFFVSAGMQLDYNLSFTGETLKSPYSNEYDIRDIHLYAQFGAGFIVPLGKPYLSFEIRYSQGIFDLKHDLIHQNTFLPRTKLTNISFIIGLQLPLGRYSENYPVKRRSQ